MGCQLATPTRQAREETHRGCGGLLTPEIDDVDGGVGIDLRGDRIRHLLDVSTLAIEHVVDVAQGATLMEGAVCNGVRGINASCGGAGGCATCQVHVEEAWSSRIGERSRPEKATLRFAWKPSEDSRLACYIIVTENLEGLRVHLPERQY